LRVIADAFAFAQFAVGREEKFVRVFGKPDGSVDGHAALAESSEADVTLAMDCSGDGRHWGIVKCCEGRRWNYCWEAQPDDHDELGHAELRHNELGNELGNELLRRSCLTDWVDGDIQLRAIET